MKYSKPWRSHDEQLNLLIERGMVVTDKRWALEQLDRIGYYRLSGYWHVLRERSGPLCLLDEHGKKSKRGPADTLALDAFRTGATFQHAVDLYVFDKRLRLLVLDALERIEVALRVDVSHTLGKLDPFAYLKPDLFHEKFSVALDKRKGVTAHHEWLTKHARLIEHSKEDFVKHNRAKYGYPLAIWVACEVWDFGTLSHLYGGMREFEQDAISLRYGVSNGRKFASWLRSLNYLRNVCAHHGRLWNRNIVDWPSLPPSGELEWLSAFENASLNEGPRRCFLLLMILRHLMLMIYPHSTWPDRVKEHLQAFPGLSHLGLDLASMGAPQGWESYW